MRWVVIKAKGDTWRWDEDVKEAISEKKEVRKTISSNITEENANRYKSMKNKAKKDVSKARREKAEEALTKLQN